MNNVEILDPPDLSEDNSTKFNQQYQRPEMKVSPWILLVLFLVAFIAFDFWAKAGHRFISQQFHKGFDPDWKSTALYASIITAAFIIIILLTDVPLIKFEGF